MNTSELKFRAIWWPATTEAPRLPINRAITAKMLDSANTADPTVIRVAAMLIVYSALFQFSDAIQVTAAGALRGYQDTRVTMILTLFAYWGIGLPVGYALGLTDWFGTPSGPSGLWQGLIVGLSCAALMLSIRLTRSARKRIRNALK